MAVYAGRLCGIGVAQFLELHVVHDGERAVRFFADTDADAEAPCPTLVLVDINLPKRHGGEVLQEMRNSERCSQALVLVVTSSDSARDREQMGRLGANGYFRKPSEYDAFMKLGEMVKALLASAAEPTH